MRCCVSSSIGRSRITRVTEQLDFSSFISEYRSKFWRQDWNFLSRRGASGNRKSGDLADCAPRVYFTRALPPDTVDRIKGRASAAAIEGRPRARRSGSIWEPPNDGLMM